MYGITNSQKLALIQRIKVRIRMLIDLDGEHLNSCFTSDDNGRNINLWLEAKDIDLRKGDIVTLAGIGFYGEYEVLSKDLGDGINLKLRKIIL